MYILYNIILLVVKVGVFVRLEEKLWKKINERDSMLEEKEKEYNSSFPTMFNRHDVRFWYGEKVKVIDEEIVKLANKVLVSYGKELIKDIKDVYNNEFLLGLYEREKISNSSKKR